MEYQEETLVTQGMIAVTPTTRSTYSVQTLHSGNPQGRDPDDSSRYDALPSSPKNDDGIIMLQDDHTNDTNIARSHSKATKLRNTNSSLPSKPATT